MSLPGSNQILIGCPHREWSGCKFKAGASSMDSHIQDYKAHIQLAIQFVQQLLKEKNDLEKQLLISEVKLEDLKYKSKNVRKDQEKSDFSNNCIQYGFF